jgi:hypothetical protein
MGRSNETEVPPGGSFEDDAMRQEVAALELETLQAEEEVRLWSDGVRLASPPAVPGLSDLEAAAAMLLALATQALQDASGDERRFLESVQTRAQRLHTDIHDHMLPRKVDDDKARPDSDKKK